MFLLIVLFSFSITSCSKVPPGNVGVVVHPSGDSQGVDHEVILPGYHWLWPWTDLYLYPTFQQTYVYTKSKDEGNPVDESFTFQTKEGLEVGADIGVTFHVDVNKVSTLFQEYRNGMHEIIAVPLRGLIRDGFNKEASKVNVDYVYGEGKTILIDSVQNYVQGYFEKRGILIDKIYLVGSFRLPKGVNEALDAKIVAKQKAAQYQNEVAQSEAEAQKQIAKARGDSTSMVIRALGEARAMEAKNKRITSLLVEYERVQKWDGELPKVTGGGTPFLNMSIPSSKTK